MILESLSLLNFRSYAKKTFAFSPATTLIVGPNTAGKTNILEAIMMMATGKSFRADMDREAVRWEAEMSRVGAVVGTPAGPTPQGPEVASSGGVYRGSSFAAHPSSTEPSSLHLVHFAKAMTVLENLPAGEAGTRRATPPRPPRALDTLKLEMVLTTGEVQGQRAPLKKFLVNGVPRRQVDFVGNLRGVLFWPEHLELVTDSPSLRRKYLDSVLVQVDREYRRNLYSYERGLRQRNRLLDLINEGKAHRHQLGFWDQLLIRTGGYLTEKRGEYIHFVNNFQFSLPRRQAGISNFQILYDKSVISESRLEQYKEEEVAAKATLVGPHRDDFVISKFSISNSQFSMRDQKMIELSKYGSRGEQRLAILWLKLAELEFIAERPREAGSGSARPILLLDDIFSELDEGHRNLVLDVVGKQQTIITSAEEDVIDLVEHKGGEPLVIRL